MELIENANGRKSNKDVILPCLLDRLTDRYPRAKRDSERFCYITLDQYRDNVLRDLCWLFNSSSHISQDNIDNELEHVKSSVLTYGLLPLAGLDASNVKNIERIKDEIERAILTFEPRIMSDTLDVKMVGKKSGENSDSVIVYDIRGELWSLPFKENVFLKTEIDFQTGACSVYRGEVGEQ